MSALSFDVRPDGERCVVIAIAGEIDMLTAPELDVCLRAHRNSDLVIDLSQVDFLGSSGISVLVMAYKRLGAAGHTLRVMGEQEHVGTVIEICGLSHLFHNGSAA